ARDQGLPFADSLSEPGMLDAIHAYGVQYRDRLFSPVTTIWGFLSQVLSEDHSCRDTVSRIIAHRAASGLKRVFAQHRQLLQRPRPPPHGRAALVGPADRPAASEWPPR